ncbi:hypothetical protein Q0812_04210 [Brevundimonas sp. 2R-24]|uniref:PLAT domain-containing protein n=1 Tax=Peiella sedimenti TaxID=3061083 RepID=A0ABT8SJR5_9CAUL|nr:hypothetical protein [Caulobacteraceae bacterium XZ-24]
MKPSGGVVMAAVAVALTISAPARAGSAATRASHPALRPAFGNTIVSTYPNGRQTLLWLEPDGDFEGERSQGQRISGVWEVDEDELCLRQRRPMPLPIRYCTPIVPGGVGARWTARAPTGETVQVQLVGGQIGR